MESILGHRVGAIALHREPTAAEVKALAALRNKPAIVAVYGEAPGRGAGRPLLVVEGGPAAEDRERSLLELCRRLHALRESPVALRTPIEPGHHPAPEEIALIHGELKAVGYFHDASRAGSGYLDAASRLMRGAAFDPLHLDDLSALRDALPAAAPAVIECAPEELAEAVRRARGVFRA